jgi:hypothetical protein
MDRLRRDGCHWDLARLKLGAAQLIALETNPVSDYINDYRTMPGSVGTGNNNNIRCYAEPDRPEGLLSREEREQSEWRRPCPIGSALPLRE